MLLVVFTTVVAFYTAEIVDFDEYTTQLTLYFICETTGNKTCDRSGFENISKPVMEILFYPLIGFLPVVFIIYIVDFGAVKQFLLRRCCVNQ